MSSYDKYRVKEGAGDIETHEVFLDKLAKAKEEELGFSEKKFEIKINEKIIYSIFGLFFLCATVLFSKTFYLQTFKGSELHTLSENNKGRIGLIIPERGIIYDSNMKKLVSNSPAFDLLCDKRNFSDANEQYAKEILLLSGILKKDGSHIKNEIIESDQFEVALSQNLPQ